MAGFPLGGIGALASGFGAGQSYQQQLRQQMQLQLMQMMSEIQQKNALIQLEQKRSQMAGRQVIQLPDGSSKVIDLSDPSMVGKTIGDTEDYGQLLTALKKSGAIPQGMAGVVDTAIATPDKMNQRNVYEAVMKLVGSPTFEKTNLTPTEKKDALQQYVNSGTLPQPAAHVAEIALKSNNPAMIESVYNKVIPPVFGAGAYGIKPFTVTGYDPTSGLPYSTPYTIPARGGPASPVITGVPGMGSTPSESAPAGVGGVAPPTGMSSGGVSGGPMPGTPLTSYKMPDVERKLGEQLNSLIPQLEDLKRRFQVIGSKRWNRNIPGYWGVRYLKHGLADADVQALMQKAIQVENQANAAIAASAGTRAIGFIKMSEGHVPSGRGDYKYNMGAIDTLLDPNGPYKTVLRQLRMTPASPVAGATSGGDMPPASMIPEGHQAKFGNGKTYQNIGGTVSEVTP